MAYPRQLVSRIKGALNIGIPLKALSRLTGIPAETLKEWKAEEVRGTVIADPSVLEDIRLALLKEN